MRDLSAEAVHKNAYEPPALLSRHAPMLQQLTQLTEHNNVQIRSHDAQPKRASTSLCTCLHIQNIRKSQVHFQSLD